MNTTEAAQRQSKLRELQMAELEIVKLFTQICEAENLKYYILNGTMLGAVRHKGFVPWDDDIDIGMPRQDYEKFLRVAKAHFSSDCYSVRHFRQTPEHVDYFAKLTSSAFQIKVTRMKTERRENAWIDIHPLDGMPNNALLNRLYQLKILAVRKIYSIAIFDQGVALYGVKRSWYNRLAIMICKRVPLQKLISKRAAWNLYDRTISRYSCEGSDYIVNASGAYKFKEMFRKEVFGEGKLYDFEGMKLCGPADYDFYLKQIYGDYMTPPPRKRTKPSRHGVRVTAKSGRASCESCNWRSLS